MIEYRTYFGVPVVFWKALMKSWQVFGRNQRRDSFMISVESWIQEIFWRKKIFLSTSKIESWTLARTLRRFHPRNCHWSCVGWSHTPTHTLTHIQRRSGVLGSSREGSSTSALIDRIAQTVLAIYCTGTYLYEGHFYQLRYSATACALYLSIILFRKKVW